MKVLFILMLSTLVFASSSCDKYINDLQVLVNKLDHTTDKKMLCYAAKNLKPHIINILRVCTMDAETNKKQVKNLIKLSEIIDNCE